MSRTGGGKEVLSIAAVGVGMAALGLGALAAAPWMAPLGAAAAGAALGHSFARRPKPPARPADVRRDAEGRVENWAQLLRAVQHGGVSPELRAELWPLLLGVYHAGSTHEERATELQRLRRLYIKLVLVCRELDSQLQALRSRAACPPAAAPNSSDASDADAGAASGSQAAGGRSASAADLSVAAASVRSEAGSVAGGSGGGGEGAAPPLPGNLAAFAEAHRIIVMDAVRTDLRRATTAKSPVGGAAAPGTSGGGAPGSPTLTILPVAVGDGLPELMLVSPSAPPPAPASSEEELAELAADPAAAAAAGRAPRWRSGLAADVLWGAAHLDDGARAQMLRLVNLLSAYAVHDPETGYCQGMSDLASIFVQLFEDDALAFACFERLMRAARRNFKHDETGIRHQLQQIARVLRDTDPSLYAKLQALGAEDCMFAYRMVVVMLRRELPPAACCTLWEMQWAHEAAEAEALAATASGRGGAAAEQQMARTISGEASGPGGASTSSVGADGSGSSSGAAAGLRSTIRGLSEATAAAAAGARPGSGSGSSSTAGGGPAGGPASGAASALGPADPPEFVLQFIAAVVRAQRGRIMVDCREHDDVLRLFAGLEVDFWPAVAQARKQHRAYVGGLGSGGGGLGGGPRRMLGAPLI